MDKCQKCSEKLKGKAIIKSIWWKSYSPIECNSCKCIHYPTKRTCFIIRSFIMMSALLLPILTKNIGYYSVLVYILGIVLLTALTPIFARFYIKDEIV